MVECGICLEQYQEDEIELHRKICVLWLMFRCNLCSEDYVNKEGLWNHLDMHEIADESKEAHCCEIKAKHKFYECLLCNDKRAYSKSLYDNHVHDVHIGFLLQCSDCGENFLSEKVKNEHSFGHCKIRDQTVASDFGSLYVDQVTFDEENKDSDAKHLELSQKSSSNNSNEKHDLLASSVVTELSKFSRVNLNAISKTGAAIVDKESMNMPDAANIELKMEIKVEDTVLQEHTYLVRNEEKGHSSLLPDDVTSNEVEQEDAVLEHGIKIKEECPEEAGTITLPVSESRLQNHMKVHSKKYDPCSICGETFRTRFQRNYHKRVFHTEPLYKCLHCPKMFHFDHALRRHKMTHSNILKRMDLHAEDDNEKNHLSETEINTKQNCPEEGGENPRENIPKTLASCSICGQTFRSRHQRNYHQRVFHTKPRYKCLQCPKTFHFEYAIRRHEVTHSSIQKHMDVHAGDVKKKNHPIEAGINIANNCPENGGENLGENIILQQSTTDLFEHQKNANDRNMPLVLSADNVPKKLAKKLASCSICKKTFPCRFKRDYHLRVFHTEPRYKCPQCPKMFHYGSGLRRHKLTHVSIPNRVPKKFAPCSICGMKLFNEFQNKYHMRKFHEEPQYKCSHCSKIFYFRCTLNRHEMVHGQSKELKCSQCDKSFTYLWLLQRHMKLHSKKLFPCPICGQTFPAIYKKKYHMRIFHKEPRLKCAQCSKMFHYHSELRRHVKTHGSTQNHKDVHEEAAKEKTHPIKRGINGKANYPKEGEEKIILPQSTTESFK